MDSSKRPEHGTGGLTIICRGWDFLKSEADSNLYNIMVGGESVILVLYVDDLFLKGAPGIINDYKGDLASEFKIKDLGLMHYFLGLEVWQMDGKIFLG